jgi:hypothetical protein
MKGTKLTGYDISRMPIFLVEDELREWGFCIDNETITHEKVNPYATIKDTSGKVSYGTIFNGNRIILFDGFEKGKSFQRKVNELRNLLDRL